MIGVFRQMGLCNVSRLGNQRTQNGNLRNSCNQLGSELERHQDNANQDRYSHQIHFHFQFSFVEKSQSKQSGGNLDLKRVRGFCCGQFAFQRLHKNSFTVYGVDMPRNRKPHPHHRDRTIVDPFGNPFSQQRKRPSDANPFNERLFALQREQEVLRETEQRAGTFKFMEMDELKAIKKFAFNLFGDSQTQYPWVNGDAPFRYGGVIEGGPEEIGLLYVGFYIDPPSINAKLRRRQLVFRGCKVSEFEAQAKLIGMMT